MEDRTGRNVSSLADFLNSLSSIFNNGEPSRLTALGMSKGEYGEYASDFVLNNAELLRLSYIKTVRNVYIENNGRTTEIDLVAITEKGIFVIESKNYGGWIFGDAQSKQWMQVFKHERHQFYNPVMQNESHVRKLASYLDISTNCVFSYIVFSDRCEFKQLPPDTDHIKIIHRNRLLNAVKNELGNGRTFFVKEEIDRIYYKLLYLTSKTDEEKREHAAEVKNFKSGTVCPLCKRELRLINGKYGPFYGCTGYPQCTFKRKA